MILDYEKRKVSVAGLNTSKMQVAVDAQTIKNLIANYSRPHESCIRELCVNAYEAHFLAGKPDEPFIFHAPTKLEPWFSVQDFGIGMTEEEIHELYSVIGKSSKRGSNDLTGAFGVGSKAAYAVTNLFTIQSCRDGKKFSYICHLDEDGIPCLSEAPTNGLDTDDQNGFMVKFDVPKSEYSKFIDGIKPALAFFKTRPTITGATIEWDDPEIAVEGSFYRVHKVNNANRYGTYSSYGGKQPKIIMGQIGYPVDIHTFGYYSSIPKYIWEIEVPIGSVDINSSRETLQYSQKTKNTIEDYCQRMVDDIDTKVDGLIAGEDCAWNKGVKSKEFRDLFGTQIRKPPIMSKKTIEPYRLFADSKYRDVDLKPIRTDIETMNGVRFVLDDIARGAITRCNDLKKSKGDTILIPEASKADALKDFGILSKHLILASSLPKPDVTRSTRVKNTEKIQKLKRVEGTYISYCWQDVDPATLSPEGLYCDISHHKTTLFNKELKPTDLNTILNFLEEYDVKAPPIFGLKKGATPEPKWNKLEPWLKKHCNKHIQTYINDINSPFINTSDFDILGKIFDLSNVKPYVHHRDLYSETLKQWFTLPEPQKTEQDWSLLLEECFFYDNFIYDLEKPRFKEAFIALAKKYVKSFKLLETE